jgi:polyvinyl alcohol dehydrogenase (cytochrome)
LFFGDIIGNVYAIDAVTGSLVWRDRPDDHPSLTITASPVSYEGRLYVPLSALEVTAAANPEYACCTFRGGVAAYDAASGEKLWVTHTIAEEPREVGKNNIGTPRIAPSGAPVWAGVAVDEKRRRLYVGTGENYSSPAEGSSDAIIAFDMDGGKILWIMQATEGDAWNMACEAEDRVNCPPEDGPDYDFGAAPILVTTSDGRDIILAGQKSGDVFGLDPDDGGKVLWQKNLGRGGIQGGIHFGMAADGDVLYVPISDFFGGPRWPGEAKPGMYALNIADGETLWFSPAPNPCEGRQYCDPGYSAAATAIPGAVLAGAMDGYLRAYDRETGALIWEFDTTIDFKTLSGEVAHGGSIGGGVGPVFKDGMMYINSGYGVYFHMPGNVLLAFTIKDE